MENLAVVDSYEKVYESSADIYDIKYQPGLNRMVRLVRVIRDPSLSSASLGEHLKQADEELSSLSSFGLQIPDYEWCLAPRKMLSAKADYRFSQPYVLDPFKLAARVEVVKDQSSIFRTSDEEVARSALEEYRQTRKSVILGDLSIHQVIKGSTQAKPRENNLYYVDIEPWLIAV